MKTSFILALVAMLLVTIVTSCAPGIDNITGLQILEVRYVKALEVVYITSGRDGLDPATVIVPQNGGEPFRVDGKYIRKEEADGWYAKVADRYVYGPGYTWKGPFKEEPKIK